VNAPLDGTHADSAEATRQIRAHAARLRLAALVWEPRPFPERSTR
jgi:hypothetical protein